MVPKIVLDTNVIVSAFGWRGAPYHILRRCIRGDFRLHLSTALLDETNRVLAYPKLEFSRSQIDEFIALIVEIAAVVEPDFTLDMVAADPSDNRVLECAISAGCRYVVTGDRHLLDLGALQDIQILTLDAFLLLHVI